MVNIYCERGVLMGCDISYDTLIDIMRSPAFDDNAVISFRFDDGCRGAVIKKHINAIEEQEE